MNSKEPSASKFSRKKDIPIPAMIDASKDLDDGFFQDFVAFSRTQGLTDFIVPRGTDEPLLQVKCYIPMPEPIAKAIGTPGVPCGLITEVYGPPDSGKTTLCLELLKQTQKLGGIAMLMMTERKFDLKRAEDVGVDVKKLIVHRPASIEQVREYVHELATSVAKFKKMGDRPICVVWDSVAATPCEKELNEKRGDFAADQAAALAVLLRKTQAMIKDHSIAFVMINHVGVKMGVTFGKKTQSKGGFAPKFYSALRIEFSKIGRLRAASDTKDADFCAIRSILEVEKNHLGTPFATLEVAIDYKGFVFDRPVERKAVNATESESCDEVSAKKKKRVTTNDASE